ncbi:MAG: hypothetical protein JHC33_11975 [Ignisphaera sp.]|nr:hypothetical protein [Ignisphaera sp.]
MQDNFDIEIALNKMRKHNEELIKEIKMYCMDTGRVGKLYRHLLETKRNPYSIINDIGFSVESSASMLGLFDSIHNAFSDDGTITLYYVNGSPRISLLDTDNHNTRDFLSHTENRMADMLIDTEYSIKYDIVFVNYWEDGAVEKWIEDSIAQEKRTVNDNRNKV